MQQSKAITIFLLAIGILSFIAAESTKKNSTPARFASALPAIETLDDQKALSHLEFLAHDLLEGRESGHRGHELAANYVAAHFARLGLQPGGDHGSYFQSFSIASSHLAAASLKLSYDQSETTEAEVNQDFKPLTFTGEGEGQAEIVFAGYGITAPEYDYDDYSGINVRNKIVLVLRYEPDFGKESITQSREPYKTNHALFFNKMQNAMQHGAAGIIVVNGFLSESEQAQEDYVEPGAVLEWNSINSVPDLRRKKWNLELTEQKRAIPFFWMRRELAQNLLAVQGKDLRLVQAKIDKELKPHSFVLKRARAAVSVTIGIETRETHNVIGVFRGASGVHHEAVVIGAHLDHEGVKHHQIYNGADDNASGSAALLLTAEGFSHMAAGGERPLRDVVFIAFAGEEKGLLGSRHYVSHAAIGPENTAAMINMDMIGRNDPNELSVIGFRRSPELQEINQAANGIIGFQFKYDGEQFFYRSDQASFAAHGIPVLFYNSGLHEDYHRPGDDSEKISGEKIARVAQLATLVAWEVANSESRPTYIEDPATKPAKE